MSIFLPAPVVATGWGIETGSVVAAAWFCSQPRAGGAAIATVRWKLMLMCVPTAVLASTGAKCSVDRLTRRSTGRAKGACRLALAFAAAPRLLELARSSGWRGLNRKESTMHVGFVGTGN